MLALSNVPKLTPKASCGFVKYSHNYVRKEET